MFDIFVDHPKKRFYLLMMMFSVFIIGSIIFDMLFGFDMIQAQSFGDLMEIVMIHPNSYFGYFFYTLVTSPALYSIDVLYLVGKISLTLITSLNFFDWLTIIGILGLSFSHKHKMSKVMLGTQIGFLTMRVSMILGIFLYLYPTMMSNSANLILSRIHIVSTVVVILYMLFLIFMVAFMLNIIRLFYLPMFKEADD